MPQIREKVHTTAAPEKVFAYVDDHRNVPDWMFGVTEFTAITEKTSGVGARYKAAMKLGPKSLKTTLEVTEWVENEKFVMTSIEGFDVTSRWEFASAGDGGTDLDVGFDYNFPGGLAGRALAAVVEPIVGQAIKHTESTLRKNVE